MKKNLIDFDNVKVIFTNFILNFIFITSPVAFNKILELRLLRWHFNVNHYNKKSFTCYYTSCFYIIFFFFTAYCFHVNFKFDVQFSLNWKYSMIWYTKCILPLVGVMNSNYNRGTKSSFGMFMFMRRSFSRIESTLKAYW